jgi:hypothetical protein
MDVVAIGGMHCELGWWQTEYQPPVADIDSRKLQNVAKKCPIGIYVAAVDDCVCACNHVCTRRAI